MKQFLFYILKIILFVFVAAFAIQLMADSGLKKMKNTLFSEMDNLMNGNINSDLIILGSSRSFVSYDPQIIKSVTGFSTYNLSVNAGPYNLQEIKYEIYRRKHNKKPKIIVQNVDLVHFTASEELPDKYQFLPFLNDSLVRNRYFLFDSRFSWINYCPLLKYNENKIFLAKGLASFFGKKFLKMETVFNGFSPIKKSYKRDDLNFKRLEEIAKNPNTIKKYEKGLSHLNAFLKSAQKDSITVILVWAPEYIERMRIVKSLSMTLKKELEKIVKTQKNAYFIDMSNDSISNSTAYFYNSFHLNEKGATLFSQKLAKQIKALAKK